MKPTFLSLLFSIFVLAARAQDPQIEWQNTIGGNSGDALHSIEQTVDGGYILGGTSYSGISGDKTEAVQDSSADYWVIKLNASGNIVWQNTIGGSENDVIGSIHQTTDGGYILGGMSESGISGDKSEVSQGFADYWVLKLDTAGNIVWQNTIGGNYRDYLVSIKQTSDGGYILGGRSESGISGDKTEAFQGGSDFWVMKLDTAGNIIWQNTIGGSSDDNLVSIQQTADGGYILGGSSLSGISGDKTEVAQNTDYWVIKLDPSGNIAWQNTIGGSSPDNLNSLQQTKDEGYILGGVSGSGISGDKTEASQGSSDYWVIKLDTVGNIIWQNTMGGSNYDNLNSIHQTADGGYILGGYSYSGISGDKTEANKNSSLNSRDYWVIKLDTVGNIIWQNTIGGSRDDYLSSIQQTKDRGYILGGGSISNVSGDKTEVSQGEDDYWIIKLSDLHTISGQLLTETGIPIPGVTVKLSGDDTDSVTTDSSGRYSFNVEPGGNYTITPSKNNDITSNNGMSTIDMLLMRSHILGIAPLPSPYKIIAAAEANADGDTNVSTLDILRTRELILGNSTAFPTNRLWQFVSSDSIFPDASNPFPFDKTRSYTNITSNQSGQDFIGIKIGDVNESWDAGVP